MGVSGCQTEEKFHAKAVIPEDEITLLKTDWKSLVLGSSPKT